MTTFRFFSEGGRLTGFEAGGHSGYAESGSDIVCAAASSSVRLCCNGITEVVGAGAEVTQRERDAVVSLRLAKDLPQEHRKLCTVLMSALLLEARCLEEEYPVYVQVKITEV